MPFNSQNLYLDRATMNSTTPQVGVAFHKYKSDTDSLATIAAAGYFNSVYQVEPNNPNAPIQLQVGDAILLQGTDATAAYIFTSVTPVALVAPLNYNNYALTPNQLPGLLFWLAAYDPFANGIIPPDGTQLATWADKSGNGNDFTQSTLALRPVWNSNQTPNGLPAISGDGTQYMETALDNGMDVKHLIAVVFYKNATSGTNQTFLGCFSNTGSSSAYYYKVDDGTTGNITAVISTSTGLKTNNFGSNINQQWYIYGSSTSEPAKLLGLQVSGTKDTDISYTGNLFNRSGPTSLFCTLNANVPGDISNMSIAEIFAFDRVVAEPDLSALLRSLSMKYSVPISIAY